MAEKMLDCRGLACPAPVLQTKELIDQGGVDQLVVWVDNEAAQQNVSRFLNRAGYEVAVAAVPEGIRIVGTRPGEEAAGRPQSPAGQPEPEPRKVMVLVGCDRLGRGDDYLGGRLLVNFLGTLKEMGPELWTLVLVNAGVKLACAGSEVVPVLQQLGAQGVNLLVCGTCLNHFQLLDQKLVGETTNMLDIVTAMQVADKVITLT